MPFKIGDKVKFLNEEGGGEVTRIVDENNVEITDDHGFEYVVRKSELVSEGKSAIDHGEIRERLKEKGGPGSAMEKSGMSGPGRQKMKDYLMESRKYWTSKDKDFIEIDLHIEELIDKPGHMTDGQKLQFQLDHARFCLEEAISMRMKRLVFIHGVGSGVLRHELRQWLTTLTYVHLENANYRRYGIGATEVCIHNDVFNT